MALITCKDCGKEISDAALSCPNCGRPNDAGTSPQPAEENKPKMIKTNSSGGFAALVLAAIFLYFAWPTLFGGDKTEPVKEPQRTVEQSVTQQNPAKVQPKTFLSFNADSFKTAFNNAGKKIKSPLKIGSLKVEKGEVNDVFTVLVGEHISIVGAIDKKTQKLIWLIMNGSGDGSQESGAEIMMGIIQVITTFFPELKPEERGKILTEIAIDKLIVDGDTNYYVGNGLKLSMSLSSVTGLTFIVSPAE